MKNATTIRLDNNDEIRCYPRMHGAIIHSAYPQSVLDFVLVTGSPRKMEELAHALLVAAAEQRKAESHE